MAIVNEFKCPDCGLKLKDGKSFIWNDENMETKDFLIL